MTGREKGGKPRVEFASIRKPGEPIAIINETGGNERIEKRDETTRTKLGVKTRELLPSPLFLYHDSTICIRSRIGGEEGENLQIGGRVPRNREV